MSSLTVLEKRDILASIEDSDEILWCSGSISCLSNNIPLFYKIRGSPRISEAGRETEPVIRCVDLLSATPDEIESLSNACDPATFGVNQENVLDESYRKAGKLDLENFALNFSPEQLGFASIIKKALLTADGRDIIFEMYKINVYGEGSFFKPHKDTPRSQRMFGSLVIVFPTAHEGGALVLSHRKRSSTINFAKMLKNQPANAVAYAAFYSDVNHQVTKVRSGRRVSLTYNLYYADKDESESKSSKHVHVESNTSYERAYERYQETLSRLLQDSTFLPKGGVLCFQLHHEYPIPTNAIIDIRSLTKCAKVPDKPLEPLKQYLKGSDAVIYNVCVDLGLTTALKFVYNGDLGWEPESSHLSSDDDDRLKGKEPRERQRYYLCDYGLQFDDRQYDGRDNICSDLSKYCEKFTDGKGFTWLGQDLYEDAGNVGGTSMKSAYMAYGNEASLEFIYGTVSLVVSVGRYGTRGGYKMKEKKQYSYSGSEDPF